MPRLSCCTATEPSSTFVPLSKVRAMGICSRQNLLTSAAFPGLSVERSATEDGAKDRFYILSTSLVQSALAAVQALARCAPISAPVSNIEILILVCLVICLLFKATLPCIDPRPHTSGCFSRSINPSTARLLSDAYIAAPHTCIIEAASPHLSSEDLLTLFNSTYDDILWQCILPF